MLSTWNTHKDLIKAGLIAGILTVVLLSVWSWGTRNRVAQPRIAVVNVDLILREVYQQAKNRNLSEAEEKRFLEEVGNSLQADFKQYAIENNLTLFAKGSVISEAVDVTQDFLK